MKKKPAFVADYHTHTLHSHGRGTVLQNARVAYQRGLSILAVTDHGPANLFGVGVQSPAVYDEIRKEAEEAMQVLPGLRVLTGAEANVIGKDGEIDIPPEVEEKLDILIVGLHIMVRPKVLSQAVVMAGVNMMAALHRRAVQAALAANTDALVAAVYRHRVDIVAHPGYRLPIDTNELAKACAARGTAMEINTGHQHVTSRYVQTAYSAGARLVINSDAHVPERVGDLAGGIELLSAAAVPLDAVVNIRGSTSNLGRS